MRASSFLLYAVGFTVAANQLFVHSALKSRTWAYVLLQAVNTSLAVFAGFFPPQDFSPQLQGLVQIFLVLFAVWHGVIAWQARWNLLAERRTKERLAALSEFEKALAEKRATMEGGAEE